MDCVSLLKLSGTCAPGARISRAVLDIWHHRVSRAAKAAPCLTMPNLTEDSWLKSFCCWFKENAVCQCLCICCSCISSKHQGSPPAHSLSLFLRLDCLLSGTSKDSGIQSENERERERWILELQTWWDLQSQHNPAAKWYRTNTSFFLSSVLPTQANSEQNSCLWIWWS